ncbi:alpha-phosphoglucomutase [Acetivibrio thermocellus AD2]|jgi:phosphoglucomutase|uniref:Phosphoglucomutase n=1 Tax=Acetivibrio thermocellus AD2 TaxID=1138384 RepID=A0AB36TFG4_ACETH|nr:phospho-sugar mutase [Acetivibrio thermocellus]ADU74061.1 phosphoglucomutase/phosphomannomutase alpha/beta/alpha domain I [Acetivibrio thermocellus DSM 1313]ALX07999.1 phosphoglucomutase/phosphomannomutase alpha/beta/alpha domain I [Acetivibrio thermocellus AD2]ANV75745.1 phosphoglucomutase/phosphomannomutase alpha/beta/alpha domain I [Acetivibrio thermocellus DSM 2360]EIC06197.1 phosphoglucomutase/phosphomannomutase alpha/beta/alpha domain I [Acetivibrio thermocellus YS]NLU26552.1 phospho-
MRSSALYKFWVENDYFDAETKKELLSIKDNPKEIEERFYKDLEFGTGGLRGIIGAGTNRINIYTVRKASQGLADYIKSLGLQDRGIAIAYDSRYKSPEFALEAAKVFAGNGIKAFLFDELRPTPELSFTVRHLNAAAGVVITASHNPKEYNGYKVYGEDGGQLPVEASNKVISYINKIEDITQVKVMEKDEAIEKGLLRIIGKEIDDEYISKLKTLSVNPELAAEIGKTFKIVYTPLHGTGNKPVRRILDEIGFKNVLVVKEQELPDSEFSTVKSPNPEEREAFELAIELAKKENVDLIIGTDPDCDRVGIVVRNKEGEYVPLTGNQTGCLLLEYILSQKKQRGELPENGFVVKTIVTTELARAITDAYNVELVEVLTGFKFIGEKIKQLDEFGDKKYLFGFEESYGYLAGTFARDKDAVVASMLIAEMAAYYKSRGLTLYEGLMELLEKYGYTLEGITSFTLKGKDGVEKIKSAMKNLRENRVVKFGEYEAVAVRDYLTSERYEVATGAKEKLTLVESDVLYYELKDKAWFCIRPSGTEPKIKIYYGVTEKSMDAAKEKLKHLQDNVLSVIEPLLKD